MGFGWVFFRMDAIPQLFFLDQIFTLCTYCITLIFDSCMIAVFAGLVSEQSIRFWFYQIDIHNGKRSSSKSLL